MAPYAGAPVSQTFRERWMTSNQVGAIAPTGMVEIRRGHLKRKQHPVDEFGGPIFAKTLDMYRIGYWYPDWTPTTDWMTLDAVQNIKLDQSFDQNGITTATIAMDNIVLTPTTGRAGLLYHVVNKGYYTPLRGFVGKDRPDPGVPKTPWFNMLPNAQIRVRQGYGADSLVTTFLGLVDDVDTQSNPNTITLTCRDFGGVLVDEHVFGWAKERIMQTPVIFATPRYVDGTLVSDFTGNTIFIQDVADIVRVVLRWAGFKYWEVEDTGVGLSQNYLADPSMTLMDLINTVKDMVGYTFFIAEPRDDDDDNDLGYPIFRRNRVFENYTGQTEFIDDSLLLTDAKVKVSNADDRCIIRCRGVATTGGVSINGDSTYRLMFAYIPRWVGEDGDLVAGVLKPLTHTDDLFTTLDDCEFACYLIALQIALLKYTTVLDLPCNPGIGMDTLQAVIDRTQGLNSRVYITNRTQEMQFGSNGYWTMELGGSLVDTPDTESVIEDYQRAIVRIILNEKNPWLRNRTKTYGYEDG